MTDKLLACPSELAGVARQEWFRIVRRLTELHLISVFDLPLLRLHCETYALWAEAVAELKKGAVISESGQQSPWLSVANRQGDKLMRLAKELGFSPKARLGMMSYEAANSLCLQPRPAPTWDGKKFASSLG